MDDLMRMVLALIILFLIATTRVAQAQQFDCVGYTQAWTATYTQGSIQSVTYFQEPPYMIGVLWRTGQYALYTEIPPSVANRFTNQKDADALFASLIQKTYCQVLLTVRNICPSLNENGAFLLNAQYPRCIGPPPLIIVLADDGGTPLATDSGQKVLTPGMTPFTGTLLTGAGTELTGRGNLLSE